MEEKKNSLSIKEKISLTSGDNFWEFHNENKNIRCSDGPCGVRFVKDVNMCNDNEIIDSTCFLSPSSAANTFNTELLYKLGEGLGKEAKHNNVDLLLTPGINIKRTPLNGRNFEYYSEDPYLSGILASALINGIKQQHVEACVKHLACNNKEDYRYTNNSIVDERALNELYLNAFRLVIEKSNPLAVMTSYNKLNNKYVSENKELLDKMRNDYNFRGLFISDWGGVNNPVSSFKAGLNIEMPGNSFSRKLLENAYENNEISEEELNNNTEIIQQNFNILLNNRLEKINYDQEEIKQIAYEVAKESPVLLKNDNNVLPLQKNDSFLVVGQLFEYPNVSGYGSSRINFKKTTSFKQEFDKYTTNYKYCKGYSLNGKHEAKLNTECLNLCKQYQKIIYFMGYKKGDFEGVDRKNINLPINQLFLLYDLIKLNKEIIVILNTGNVVELPFKDNVNAILQSGLLGEVHERVVTEILFGDINPSGKLNETYPKLLKDNKLLTYNVNNENITKYKESLYVGYRYYDSYKKEVSYPFGFGLSYSTFRFSNLSLIKEDQYRYTVSFIIENDSEIDGSEVCQVYVRKKTSNNYHSYQQLKAFKKVFLKAHEKQTVQLILDDHSFELYNDKSHHFEIESGVYEICIGNSSRNISLIEFINIEGNETEPRFKISELSSYFRYKYIEDFEFNKLVGFEYSENNDDEITLNTTLKELKKSSLGNLIYKKIKKQYLKQNIDLPKKQALKMLDYLPIRMLVTMSNGALSYDFANKIVESCNKNFIAGTYKLLKYKHHNGGDK